MKIVSKYQHQKLSFRNWLVILTAVLFPFTILLAQSKGPAKGRGNPAVAFEVTQLPKAEASVGEVHVHPTFPSKSSRHEEQIKSAPAADVSIEPDISGPGSNPENLIINFAGIAYTHAAPPDPVIAAGPNHLVLVVNHTIEIYNKSGTKLQTNTLTNWFSDTQPPPPGDDPFDPKVVYDHYSGRWIVLALAKDDEALSSYLISVSQTSDPTGAWYKYNLDATLNGSQSTNYWADFPGLGYDSQAIYLTSDQLTFHTDLLAYYSCSHALHGNTFIIEAIASNNSPI